MWAAILFAGSNTLVSTSAWVLSGFGAHRSKDERTPSFYSTALNNFHVTKKKSYPWGKLAKQAEPWSWAGWLPALLCPMGLVTNPYQASRSSWSRPWGRWLVNQTCHPAARPGQGCLPLGSTFGGSTADSLRRGPVSTANATPDPPPLQLIAQDPAGPGSWIQLVPIMQGVLRLAPEPEEAAGEGHACRAVQLAPPRGWRRGPPCPCPSPGQPTRTRPMTSSDHQRAGGRARPLPSPTPGRPRPPVSTSRTASRTPAPSAWRMVCVPQPRPLVPRPPHLLPLRRKPLKVRKLPPDGAPAQHAVQPH